MEIPAALYGLSSGAGCRWSSFASHGEPEGLLNADLRLCTQTEPDTPDRRRTSTAHRRLTPGEDRSAARPDQQTRKVLEAVLATSGAQDAANTALTAARDAAVQATRRAVARDAEQAAAKRAVQSDAARRPTPEHTADVERLRQLQRERDQLNGQQREVVRAAQQTRAQLAKASRWAGTRRRDLTVTLAGCDNEPQQHPGQLPEPVAHHPALPPGPGTRPRTQPLARPRQHQTAAEDNDLGAALLK